MSEENTGVRLGLKDRFRDAWDAITPTFKTVIFRNSVVLFGSLFLMIGGTFEAFRYIKEQEYIQLMTVSPTNVGKHFALSDTKITIQDQFRDGSVFAIPLVFENFQSVSPNAETYEMQIQGTKTPLADDIQMKLILFGASGRGVILVKGTYTGEPMNVYLQSNATVNTEVEGIDLDDFDIGDAPLKVLEEGEFLTDNTPTGTMEVGGMELPVNKDVVNFTVNPSAENVVASDIPFSLESTPGEVYNAVFAPRDRAVTRLERDASQDLKNQLLKVMEEYENRLEDLGDLSEEAKQKVIGADAIAVNSTGSEIDSDQMNDLLSSVGQEMQASEDTSELSASEAEALLRQQIDMEDIGGDKTSSKDVLEVLSMIRRRLITVNRKMEVADQKMREIGNIVEGQDDQSSSTMDFDVIAPF